MLDAKKIVNIHNKKEEIKLKQNQLLMGFGYWKTSSHTKKSASEALGKMLELREETNDYDTFIELEMEYVALNKELLDMGLTYKDISE